MSLELDLNNVKPLVSNDLLKTVIEEFNKMLFKISTQYELPFAEVKELVKQDMNKFGVKLGVKKRNRRVLPKEKQCMGRKLDGHQCTRGRYREDSEYCKSHANKLPLGRIDDELAIKEPSQRGRKKKNGKKSLEYIVTSIQTIGDQNYLVDDRNFVFSFDTKSPEFLGIKIDDQIKSLAELGLVC
tara:strand:+ start:46 stop:600 length:555 start_codon:yes stop_codon:yes gene_type:complete